MFCCCGVICGCADCMIYLPHDALMTVTTIAATASIRKTTSQFAGLASSPQFNRFSGMDQPPEKFLYACATMANRT